jgi:uncharacterized GH25 family protein
MKKILVLTLFFILFSSHELFLKTDSYFMKSNQASELYLYNGTFDGSENVISRDRIINARILGPGYEYYPEEQDYYDNDKITYLKFTTGESGTYVAGISTLPRDIELSAPDFMEYLEHEGLLGTIEDRENKAISDQPAVEKYSKHVKALLQVGEERTVDYATVLGYPIEFIPLINPYDLSEGDEISFRLLYNNSPVPNQVVHISSRSAKQKDNIAEKETRTDARGELSFTLDKKGQWYVASIYMQESKEQGLDYESNWATLTFEIR